MCQPVSHHLIVQDDVENKDADTLQNRKSLGEVNVLLILFTLVEMKKKLERSKDR